MKKKMKENILDLNSWCLILSVIAKDNVSLFFIAHGNF